MFDLTKTDACMSDVEAEGNDYLFIYNQAFTPVTGQLTAVNCCQRARKKLLAGVS